MYTRIYEYGDIIVANEPHILYKLPINNQYTVIAVCNKSDDTIRLMITDADHNFVDINGNIVSNNEPYISTVVFNTHTVDVENLIKSEMMKLASNVYDNLVENNISEGDSNTMWEELKRTDPFSRGWSTNPQDALDTLKELGFKVTNIERGIVDFSDKIVTFQDSEGNEGELYINRVGQNTFKYNIHSDMYDEEHDDLHEPEIDADDLLEDVKEPQMSVDDICRDSEKCQKYLTIKYHFLGKGYSDEEATNLAISSLDKETIDEAAIDAQRIVTVGLYGDDPGKYESLEQMVTAMKSAGLQVTNVTGDEEYGWSFDVRGPAKKIYKMVDDTIPGYSCDSVQEFVDQYSIDESSNSNCDEAHTWADVPGFAEDNEKAKEYLEDVPTGSILVFNEEIPTEDTLVYIKLKDGSWVLRDAPYAERYTYAQYDEFIYLSEPDSYIGYAITPSDPKYHDYDNVCPIYDGDFEGDDGTLLMSGGKIVECTNLKEDSNDKCYALIRYKDEPIEMSDEEAEDYDPRSMIEPTETTDDDYDIVMLLGAEDPVTASEQVSWVRSHPELYNIYGDLDYIELTSEEATKIFGNGMVLEGYKKLDVHRDKVGDKVYISTIGMSDPHSYSVGDDIKIGALRGTIDKIQDDRFYITITYNGFLNEKRVEYEDDLIIIKDKDGKVEYKGLFDYSPYKDEQWKYDSSRDLYTLPCGHTMKCIDETVLKEDYVSYTSEKKKISVDQLNDYPAGTICKFRVYPYKENNTVAVIKNSDGESAWSNKYNWLNPRELYNLLCSYPYFDIYYPKDMVGARGEDDDMINDDTLDVKWGQEVSDETGDTCYLCYINGRVVATINHADNDGDYYYWVRFRDKEVGRRATGYDKVDRKDLNAMKKWVVSQFQ